MDIKDFWRELWLHIGTEPGRYKHSIVYELTYLGDCISRLGDRIKAEMAYDQLCHIAVKISKNDRRAFSGSIHSRMILGPQNKYSKEYSKLVAEKWDSSKESEPAR